MINTFLGYQLIARDMNKSIQRVEAQPLVKRETEYFLDKITKVKSIEEFVDDSRLFKYAMKAFGLADMDYAKAFMVKALKEGVSDPDSFANKLTDKRYAEFVKTFNFAARGDRAVPYIPAQQGVVDRFTLAALQEGVSLSDPALAQANAGYLAAIADVKSIDDFLANEAVYQYAMKAHGLTNFIADKAFIRDVLENGIVDPDSPANRNENKNFRALAASLDFATLGERTTTYAPALDGVVDKFNRQTLEEDAGSDNEGVRLALYFQRKASGITNAFDILADRALTQVTFTALGLPSSFSTANIDRQAALLEERLDFSDFQSAELTGEFLKRFTSLWEIENPTSTVQTSVGALFGQPIEFGISTNVLLTIQKMKR